MKTYQKILVALLAVIIALMVGLNLYFTDERLKKTVMPYVNDAVGREVHVESMSLTLFSTFPHPGLSIRNLHIPGEGGSRDTALASDTLLALSELVAGVKLFPLLADEISISEIQLRNPRFIYRVFEDGSTNIDFLLQSEQEAPAGDSEGYSVDIPYFFISGGRFGYDDQSTNTSVTLAGLDADISLRYADLINSSIEIELDGLSFRSGETQYIDRLPLNLSETSIIDPENETIDLESGTLSIRSLALNLTGTVGNWSDGTADVDLRFISSTDNFGELLQLAPSAYAEQLEGLETRGSFSIDGTLSGALGGETLPAFNADLTVTDGYLKNPDLQEPVHDIQIRLSAGNKRVNVEAFRARAGANFITASGELERPLDEDGAFRLALKGDVDLSTVENFYSLADLDIGRLGGRLTVDATARGRLDRTGETSFEGNLKLAEGLLKYADVSGLIENINFDATGNQDLVTINSLDLEAAQNRLSAQGRVSNPLDEENRAVDLTADLFFDLATIKNFYPIDEDTLKLGGQLIANAILKGRADQIERAVQSGMINLENGFVDYTWIGKPIEDLMLKSTLKGNLLTISTARFRSGKNDLEVSGTVTDYLGDNPVLDLNVSGNAQFAEIQNYYDLKPAVTRLTGTGLLNLAVKGPVQTPERMAFDGSATVTDLNMGGDSLMHDVTGLYGELNLTPGAMELAGLGFSYGSSDLKLSGKLTDYMEYLKIKGDRKTTPGLTGRFESQLFNLDELIDWEDNSSTPADQPIPIELPDLNSSVAAKIDTLIVTGVPMSNLVAEAGTTPRQIKLTKASVGLLGGTASGSFTWNVPRPDHTNLSFNGSLEELNTASFFREFEVLGSKNEFHEHITGSFSANVEYYSVIDAYLNPQIPTTRMNGTFTLKDARIREHPLQNRLASLLKADELRDVTLDESVTQFGINNSVLTIENLRMTSGNIGAEMNGTKHLISDAIDYDLSLYLPGSYRDRIASVITLQAVEALTQENGTILLPLRVTGTQGDPRIRANQEIIQPIIRDMLKKKAGDAIRNLFGGDG